MANNRKRLLAVLVSGALAGGLAACGSGDSGGNGGSGGSSTSDAKGGTLYYLMEDPIEHLDPQRVYVGRDISNLSRTVYRTLVTFLIWATWGFSTGRTASTPLVSFDIGLILYCVPSILLAPVWLRTGLLPKGVPLRLVVVMVAGAGALFFQITAAALHVTPAAPGGILLGGSMPLATALIGMVLFGESRELLRIGSILSIVAGIAGLKVLT